MPRRAPADIVPRRYGDDDLIGAANEITPEGVLRAASLVRSGRRYALGQILDDTSPAQMWRYWKHSLLTDRVLPERSFGTNEQTFLEECVSGALHSGTHLDGLAHIGIGEHLYNGHRWADVIGPDGVTLLGAENIPPIFTRGVLLDVAALHGTDVLGHEQAISAEDLESAAQAQGVAVEAGDVVLVHTGWGRHWGTDNERYRTSEPGIDMSAAQWCTGRRVCVIGADNWAVEQVTVEPGDLAFPVHQETITRNGVYLLENVRTEELAADQVWEFCCVIAPTRLRGASASMVGPVAVI
jgi:kynurenine formamidase